MKDRRQTWIVAFDEDTWAGSRLHSVSGTKTDVRRYLLEFVRKEVGDTPVEFMPEFPEDVTTEDNGSLMALAEFKNGEQLSVKAYPLHNLTEREIDLPGRNTRISYLYRDRSNYKAFNEVVIPGVLTHEQITDIISVLHDGEYFIPFQVGLPEERPGKYDPDEDHIWFELDESSFEVTTEGASGFVPSAEKLYSNFMKVKEIGWDEEAANERIPIPF